MELRQSWLRTDLLIHLVSLLAALTSLIPGGLWQSGITPPLLYPFFLILATVTLFRQNERLDEYQTRLIFVPAAASVLLYGFSLVNEMTRDYWAFTYPRHYAVLLRWLWVQAGLLLIHPEVFPKVFQGMSDAVERLRRRGYFGRYVWIACLLAVLVMWQLRNLSISPDGYDWIKHSIVPKEWVYYLREPLGTFLFRLVTAAGQILFDWEPYPSIVLFIFACGLASTALAVPLFRRLFGEDRWGICFAFLLSCTGYTQLFFGNIEIYAQLQLGLVIFLYAALRYWEGEWPIWKPGLAFGILFCLHLSTGWWLPAFLLLPLLKPRERRTSFVFFKEYAVYLSIFCTVVIAFWTFVLLYGYDGDLRDMAKHFVGDEVMYVGADGAMFNPVESYIQWDYYITMLNEYFFMLPGLLLLLPAVFLSFRKGSKVEPLHVWFFVMALFYIVYSFVWHPDRKFPADWDLFSGVTIPLVIVLCQRITTLKIPSVSIKYILYQATVFSGLYLSWILVRNHIKGLDWVLFQ